MAIALWGTPMTSLMNVNREKISAVVGLRSKLILSIPFVFREAVLPLFSLLVYYSPFLFFETSYVPIHDVFDGHVAEDRAVRDFYIDGKLFAEHIVGGAAPVWAMSRFAQPLSVFVNMFLPILPAYLIIDLIVRSVTYISFRLLAERLGLSPTWGVGVALVIASGVTFTIYGFSAAGFALLMAVALNRRPGTNVGFAGIFAVFLVGWNTSLSVHSIFIVSGFILVSLLMRFRVRARKLFKLAALFMLGSVIGNFNILYAQFLSGIAWHRDEFACPTCTLDQSLQDALTSSGVFTPFFVAYMYHVSVPLTFLVAFSAIISITDSVSSEDRRRIWIALFLGFAFPFLAPFVRLTQNLELFDFLPSFQFDRLAIWGHLFFVVAILISLRNVNSLNIKKVGALMMALQLGFSLLLTPHIRATYNKFAGGSLIELAPAGQNFYDFIRESDYKQIRNLVGAGRVMSLGVDPSSAILNGINSANGYLTQYPLSYKREWLGVINKVIQDTEKESYFKDWGGRVYTFAGPDNYLKLDLCSEGGQKLDYAVSSFELDNESYKLIWSSVSRDLLLYKITLRCD